MITKVLNYRPDHENDISQAETYKKYMEGTILHTPQTGFLFYNGCYWEDKGDNGLGAAEEFCKAQLDEAVAEYNEAVKAIMRRGITVKALRTNDRASAKDRRLLERLDKAERYLNFAMKSNNMTKVTNMIKAVVPMVHIDCHQLDAKPTLLNTPIGTVDLCTGAILPHQLEDYITKSTACSPGKQGEQLWLDALDTFFGRDEAMKEYVQQIMGSALVGDVNREEFIIAYGEGANGKSTFFNSIAQVLGSYSGTVSSDIILQNSFRNIKPEIARLQGLRLATAGELEENKRLTTATVKQLCSTDPITGERKYHAPTEFQPTHTLVLYTNHLPSISTTDTGTWRRITIIPFFTKIEGSSDKKNYTKFLVREASPYILQWLIDGAIKAIACDYNIIEPKCITELREQYREENDIVGHFIEERCAVDRRYSCKSTELYREYVSYCDSIGEPPLSIMNLKSTLIGRGYSHKKRKDANYYLGIRLGR